MSENNTSQASPSTGALPERSLLIAVFLIGFVSLGYELLQVKMLSFFLGSISNFLAIPIALFGLALGSLFCHFIYRGDPHKLIGAALLWVFPVMLAILGIFFVIANTFFPDIHVIVSRPGQNAARLVIYSTLFLPPYFIFGMLLSSIFSLNPDRIGRLYFFDLAGAALGCMIVPILFTYTDLFVVILVILLSSMMLIATAPTKKRNLALGVAGAIWIVTSILAYNGILFREKPNVNLLARTLVSGNNVGQEELVVRWNDIARTSLIQAFPRSDTQKQNPTHVIVQDDGISNVRVFPYDPGVSKETMAQLTRQDHAIPFALDLQPKNILVMFAGAGRDMVILDALADRKAKITGVEINPTVVDYATDPHVNALGLKAFLSRPGIQLVKREGRDFLNNAEEKYDLIFTATNGSVHASRTGHTRKYLDTYEAMTAYLDHLTPDGVMFFFNQPIEHKLVSFRKLFKERGYADIEKSVYAYGDPNADLIRSMVIKPSGLSKKDIAALEERNPNGFGFRTLFSPGLSMPRFASILKGQEVEDLPQTPITDDDPFINRIVYNAFSLFPGEKLSNDPRYASDWIKIFTVLMFVLISVAVILFIRLVGSQDKRLPFLWLSYFFVAGIGYMGVQIGLIAKVELFVGNPLYAVAVILATFLLFNALGAFLQDKYQVMRGWKTLLIFTTIAVAWSVVAATLCNVYLLSIPLPLKVLAVALSVFPAGMCLGMYYPFGVATLVKGGRGETVPATYAIATLSSVVGSAIAMTAITNYGFSTVIAAGAACYACVAFLYIAARRFALQ